MTVDSNDDRDELNLVNYESPITINECLHAMKNIARRFIASTGEVPNAVTEVEQALLSISQQQSKMTKFFQENLQSEEEFIFPKIFNRYRIY